MYVLGVLAYSWAHGLRIVALTIGRGGRPPPTSLSGRGRTTGRHFSPLAFERGVGWQCSLGEVRGRVGARSGPSHVHGRERPRDRLGAPAAELLVRLQRARMIGTRAPGRPPTRRRSDVLRGSRAGPGHTPSRRPPASRAGKSRTVDPRVCPGGRMVKNTARASASARRHTSNLVGRHLHGTVWGRQFYGASVKSTRGELRRAA